jgi:transcriptional regulator with XRE-family HTH domain
MSTSHTTTGPSEPIGANKISRGTLAYICARHRQRQYDLVIREFKKSGLTQKQLADRLGSTPDVISRLFARPSNWEADTFARLMFAISGAVPSYGVTYPFRPRAAVSPAATESAGKTGEPWIVTFSFSKNLNIRPTTGTNVIPFPHDRAVA